MISTNDVIAMMKLYYPAFYEKYNDAAVELPLPKLDNCLIDNFNVYRSYIRVARSFVKFRDSKMVLDVEKAHFGCYGNSDFDVFIALIAQCGGFNDIYTSLLTRYKKYVDLCKFQVIHEVNNLYDGGTYGFIAND